MPSTTSVNLGQVAAVITSPTAPTNTNVMWLDNSGSTTIKKIWDPNSQTWIPFTQAGTVAGDNWGTQVVVTDKSLTGNGTTASPLGINPNGATSGQVLAWTGTQWSPVNPPTGGLSVVTADSTLKGNGTTGQPLGLASQNATQGQVLTWNGSAWLPGTPVFNGFVRGMIMIWNGTIASIPTGWTLCDGTNGSPNLSGMFVVGYSVGDSDYAQIGNTGGAKTVALNANQNGPHTHGVNDPGHTHGMSFYTDRKGGNQGFNVLSTANNGYSNYTTNTGGNTTGITIQNSGGGQAHENRPPYYTLAYIMKL